MDNSQKFKHSLYQKLPDDVFDEEANGAGSCQNVTEFVSDVLPICEAKNAEKEIRKTNMALNLSCKLMKKAKPRSRRIGLSQRDRRIAGLFRLPRISITYEEALPMNKMWQSYMHRFLNLENLRGKEWFNPKNGNLWEQMCVTLVKADYHGAFVRVGSSLCNSLIGLEGIVVIDTKFTFQIIGKDDVSRVVPKESCIFEVFLKNYKFKIFGKYFCIRPSERSTKKIKCSFIPTL